MMKSLEYCAKQAVRTCAALKPGEKVVIIYDNAAKKIAVAIDNQAQYAEGKTEVYCMETYGQRPDNGTNPLKFPDDMRRALESADVSFYVAGNTKEGELESFRVPMLGAVEENKRLRHLHLMGISEDAFLRGMSVDYNNVRDFSMKINEIVKGAKTISVTTPAGSNFTAEVGKYKWAIADGFPTPGKWVNLPDGETFTTTSNLEGHIVVDGVLGDWFSGKYGLLEKTPLALKVSHSRIIRIQCPKNRNLEKDFIRYIDTDQNSNRAGEFAIGTNLGLEKLIGNMIHDEKFPGVHVAFGDPLGEVTGAEWESKVYCDVVMQKCNIFVDGTQIMEDGKFHASLL